MKYTQLAFSLVSFVSILLGVFMGLGFSHAHAQNASPSSLFGAIKAVRASSELTKNPFIIQKELRPSRIAGVVSEAREIREIPKKAESGGVFFVPIKIGFLVLGTGGNGLDKKEVPIPHIDGNNFRYELIKRVEKNSKSPNRKPITLRLSHRTRFQGSAQHRGRYIAELSFPNHLADSGGGDYDLLISLKTPTKVSKNNSNTAKSKSTKSIQKRVQNAFFLSRSKVNLVFLIDNSASMNRNDPMRARFSSIYEVLAKRKYSGKINEVALITFSQKAEIMFPFMNVTKFNRLFNASGGKQVLRPLHPEFNKWTRLGRGNTDFAKAFNLVYKLIEANKSKVSSKNHKTVLVFLTDGASNYPYQDEHLKLRAAGVPVYTVGLSHSDHLQEYQPKFLQKVSAESGGRFFPAKSEVLSTVFNEFVELSTKGVSASRVLLLKPVYDPSELIAVSYSGYSAKNQQRASYSRYSQNQKLLVKAYFKKTGKVSKTGKGRKTYEEYELALYYDKAGVYYFAPIGEMRETSEIRGKFGLTKATKEATELEKVFSKDFANQGYNPLTGKNATANLRGNIRVWVGLVNKSGKVASTIYNKSFPVQIRPVRTVFLTENPLFERINPHKPDIRYFTITNRSKNSVFVDIELLNPRNFKILKNSKNSKEKLENPIFEHFPLSLSPTSTEIKTIIFPPATPTTASTVATISRGSTFSSSSISPFAVFAGGIEERQGRQKVGEAIRENKMHEYKLIVKTSEGDYLETFKFNYQDGFNKTTVFNELSNELSGVSDSPGKGVLQKLLPTSFFKSEAFKIVFLMLHLLAFLQIFKIWLLKWFQVIFSKHSGKLS